MTAFILRASIPQLGLTIGQKRELQTDLQKLGVNSFLVPKGSNILLSIYGSSGKEKAEAIIQPYGFTIIVPENV